MRIAIVNDELLEVVNVVKANSIDDVENGIIAETWMSPGIKYTIEGGVRTPIPPTPPTKDELIEKYRSERDSDLSQLTSIVDGMEFWTRPDDLGDFQLGIQTNETEWFLKNKTVATVTTAQLTQAMDHGVLTGKTIWAEFMSKVKDLG